MEISRVECELPDKLAGLDILEHGTGAGCSVFTSSDPALSARVLRKRKSTHTEVPEPGNRRVKVKPRKRLASEMSSPKEIEALYLCKKVRATSATLETIPEEAPAAETADSVTLIGGRRARRLLTFQLGSHYTKEKIRKRRSKIKKFLGNKSFLNRKKIPMQVFLETIQCLELDKDLPAATDTHNQAG